MTEHSHAVPAGEPTWWAVVRTSLARAVVVLLASLTLWSVAPLALGWSPELIMTGSMRPSILPGDVVLSRPVDPSALALRQVLTVDDPDHAGRTRTHRLHAFRADGTLELKGDANPQPDSSTVARTAVHGVGTLRVPFVGLPVLWLRTGAWARLALTMLALTWCLLNLRLRFPEDEGPGTDEDHAGGGAHRAAPATIPGQRAAELVGSRLGRLSVIPLVMVTMVLGAGAADAAFRTVTSNTASSFSGAADYHPYRTEVLADSPLFLWRLDERTGTTMSDASGNGYTGTLLSVFGGTYAQAQPGALAAEPYSTSVSTQSSGVNSDNSMTGPGSFTVEAWVRTTDPDGGRVVGFGNATGVTASTVADRQLYLTASGKAAFGVGSAKTVITSPAVVNDGKWHLLDGSYSPATGMRLYVDGSLVATSAVGTPVAMTGWWRVGGEDMTGWYDAGSNYFFSGNVDEVAVYPTALSATRVAAHRTTATTP